MYEYHLVNKTSTSPSHCFVRTRIAPDMPRSSDLLVGELGELCELSNEIDGVIRARAWFFFYEDTHRVFIKGTFAEIFLKTELNWSLQECKHCLVKDAFTKFGELHKCPAPSSTPPPPRKYGRTEEDQRFFGMMLGN